MRRGARQTLERRLLLSVAAHYAHENFRVTEVWRYFDTRYRDESDDSRILHAFGKERRNFLADRLGHPVRATSVTQLQSTSEYAQPAPCGSTR